MADRMDYHVSEQQMLIMRLWARGVRLRVEDDQLRMRKPRGVQLQPAERQLLSDRKDQIKGLLSFGTGSHWLLWQRDVLEQWGRACKARGLGPREGDTADQMPAELAEELRLYEECANAQEFHEAYVHVRRAFLLAYKEREDAETATATQEELGAAGG